MSEKNSCSWPRLCGVTFSIRIILIIMFKGFDINNNRINQLRKGIDLTLEVDQKKLLHQQKKKHLLITNSKGVN